MDHSLIIVKETPLDEVEDNDPQMRLDMHISACKLLSRMFLTFDVNLNDDSIIGIHVFDTNYYWDNP